MVTLVPMPVPKTMLVPSPLSGMTLVPEKTGAVVENAQTDVQAGTAEILNTSLLVPQAYTMFVCSPAAVRMAAAHVTVTRTAVGVGVKNASGVPTGRVPRPDAVNVAGFELTPDVAVMATGVPMPST